MQIKEQLLPVLDCFGTQVQFLDVCGIWPLCKKSGKYTVYSEGASQKPKYCDGCRPNDMIHVHYSNLRVHVQSKRLFGSSIVDTSNMSRCSAFGNELTGTENSTSASDHESDT